MQGTGQVLHRLDQHLVLFDIVLPKAFAVAIELDPRHVQHKAVPFGHQELSVLGRNLRRIHVEYLHAESKVPSLARLEPGLGFFHRLVSRHRHHRHHSEKQNKSK